MWPLIALAGVGLVYLVRECAVEAEEEEDEELEGNLDRNFTLREWRSRLGENVAILDADGVEKMQGKLYSIDCANHVIILEILTPPRQTVQHKAWVLKPHESVVKC